MTTSAWIPGDLLSLVAVRPLLAPTAWQPAIDVCETADSIVVTAEVAGVDEEQIEIELYPDALLLDGSRQATACGAEAVYHSAQIRSGPFHAEIGLPVDVDPDGSEATLEQGILRITLPKLAATDGERLSAPQPRTND